MKTLRNIIIIILIALIIVSAFACLYLGIFLDWAARKTINFVRIVLGGQGIELRDPSFDSAGIVFPRGVAVNGFSAHFAISKRNDLQLDRNFYLTIEKVSLSIRSIRKRAFVLTIRNALIRLQPDSSAAYTAHSKTTGLKKQEEYDRLEITRLEVPFRIISLKKKGALRELMATIKEVADLAKYGITSVPMRLSGASAFIVRKNPVRGKMLLIPHEKGYKFVMDEADFRKISDTLGERLTDAEFDVYCNNPLRMPRMLRVRNYASDEAFKAHKDDPEVPEEAYKHVLWAYLLVKAYDEKFSAEVTDGHEIGALGGEYAVRTYLAEKRGASDAEKKLSEKKSEAASQMDLVNNAIGREYAKKGYTESSLLERTKADPRIVRDVSEIGLGMAKPAVPQ